MLLHNYLHCPLLLSAPLKLQINSLLLHRNSTTATPPHPRPWPPPLCRYMLRSTQILFAVVIILGSRNPVANFLFFTLGPSYLYVFSFYPTVYKCVRLTFRISPTILFVFSNPQLYEIMYENIILTSKCK